MDHLSACDCSLSYIEGDKKICQNNHNQTGFEICFQGGFSRFQPQKKKNDRDKNTLKSGLFVLYFASHTVQNDSCKVFMQVPRIQIHANISENQLFPQKKQNYKESPLSVLTKSCQSQP